MSPPWMPLYIADYLKDTSHLRAIESGAYLHLIMSYWAKGSLPDDDRQLATIAKMTMPEWRRAKPVLKAFFSDGWKHKRIEFELTEAQRISDAGRKGGLASGQARRQRAANDRSTISERPPDETRSPSPSQSQRGGGEGDARANRITPEADELCAKLHAAMGWEPDDPRCIGNSYLSQKWLNSNWIPDLCLATVQRVKASSRREIKSLVYFENAIAEAHAEQQRPVPVAIVDQTPEVVHVKPVQADRSLSAAAWRAAESLSGDGQPEDGVRGPAGGVPVRAIPSGRGQ